LHGTPFFNANYKPWGKSGYTYIPIPHAQKAGPMVIINCVLYNTTFALKRIINREEEELSTLLRE
jgi:hypothetical protein